MINNRITHKHRVTQLLEEFGRVRRGNHCLNRRSKSRRPTCGIQMYVQSSERGGDMNVYRSTLRVPDSDPHVNDTTIVQARAPRRQDVRNVFVWNPTPSGMMDEGDPPKRLRPVSTQSLVRLDKCLARPRRVLDIQRELQRDARDGQIPRSVEHHGDPSHRLQAHDVKVERAESLVHPQRLREAGQEFCENTEGVSDHAGLARDCTHPCLCAP